MTLIFQAFYELVQRSYLELSLLLSLIPLGGCLLSNSIYALNAPYAGCQDNWFEVDVSLYFESLLHRTAISSPLAANIDYAEDYDDEIYVRFCIWNGTENPVPPTPADYLPEKESQIDEDAFYLGFMFDDFMNFADRSAGYVNSWPSGKYCIYNVGLLEVAVTGVSWDYGSCPEGFEPGSSTYPFEARPGGFGSTRYSPYGPFFTHGNRTSVEFCCTRPGPGEVARPISLPFTRPFYLLPVDDKECQPVKGADVRLDWIQWPFFDVDEGVHPFVEEGPFGNGTIFYMCYYVPNAHGLVVGLTYVFTIGSVVFSISLFLFLGWCNRKKLAWDHNRMVSLQYSGNKNDYV